MAHVIKHFMIDKYELTGDLDSDGYPVGKLSGKEHRTEVYVYCSDCGSLSVREIDGSSFMKEDQPLISKTTWIILAVVVFFLSVFCQALMTVILVESTVAKLILPLGVIIAIGLVIYAITSKTEQTETNKSRWESSNIRKVKGHHFECQDCGELFVITARDIADGDDNPKRFSVKHLKEHGAGMFTV